MFRYLCHGIASYICILFLLLFLVACAQSAPPSGITRTPTSKVIVPTPTVVPGTPMPTTTRVVPAPAHYTSRVLLQGVGRPDDLAFDQQGHLLFSDEDNGTLNELQSDGTVKRLLNDPAGPEGIVALANGTIIFSEQRTNRIVELTPGATTPRVLRTLPGTSSDATCKQGVDGIAFDPTTNTVIVPDSPTGVVYRMSLDGKHLTRLASGITRPVGAGVDEQGTIYVADECGHAVWRITSSCQVSRIGGFGMPDDVVTDGHGNLLVIDLDPTIHALIRYNLTTGKHETLARTGYIEPQGLVIDARGDIYVADDYANIIKEYQPV
jgi:sugar lactone lactonase YvrE